MGWEKRSALAPGGPPPPSLTWVDRVHCPITFCHRRQRWEPRWPPPCKGRPLKKGVNSGPHWLGPSAHLHARCRFSLSADRETLTEHLHPLEQSLEKMTCSWSYEQWICQKGLYFPPIKCYWEVWLPIQQEIDLILHLCAMPQKAITCSMFMAPPDLQLRMKQKPLFFGFLGLPALLLKFEESVLLPSLCTATMMWFAECV